MKILEFKVTPIIPLPDNESIVESILNDCLMLTKEANFCKDYFENLASINRKNLRRVLDSYPFNNIKLYSVCDSHDPDTGDREFIIDSIYLQETSFKFDALENTLDNRFGDFSRSSDCVVYNMDEMIKHIINDYSIVQWDFTKQFRELLN